MRDACLKRQRTTQHAKRIPSQVLALGWIVLCLVLVGCEANMRDQSRIKPYESSEFFENNQSERPLVPGTVARGQRRTDEAFYTGKTGGMQDTGTPGGGDQGGTQGGNAQGGGGDQGGGTQGDSVPGTTQGGAQAGNQGGNVPGSGEPVPIDQGQSGQGGGGQGGDQQGGVPGTTQGGAQAGNQGGNVPGSGEQVPIGQGGQTGGTQGDGAQGGGTGQGQPNQGGGTLVDTFPVAVTREMLQRGQNRYDIFCAPCHALTGNGDGMIVARGFSPPPSLHQDRLRNAPVGHFYDVITNGYGRMYSYASRITPADRWAIVAYIRALQLSQNARVEDVPPDQRQQLAGTGQ